MTLSTNFFMASPSSQSCVRQDLLLPIPYNAENIRSGTDGIVLRDNMGAAFGRLPDERFRQRIARDAA